MNRFTGLARIIILFVLLVILVAAVIVWLSMPRLVSILPGDGTVDVPAGAPLALHFSQPMQAESVESRLKIDPATPGRFAWEGNTLTFTPDQPWRAGQTVQVELQPGASGGGLLRLPLQGSRAWQFSVRQPRLVFLFPADGPANLYLRDPAAGANQYLTNLQTGVQDYSITPAGQIVFSARSVGGGSDLYLLDISRPADAADDGPPTPPQPELLLVCAPATCRLPVVSPDGSTLAYERSEAPAPGQVVEPQVWVAPLEAARQGVVAGDPLHPSILPSWSPQGWLTFYDQEAPAFLAILPGGGEQARFANDTGQPGTWLPDGRGLIVPEIGFLDANVSSALQQNLESLANSHLILHPAPTGNIVDLSQEEAVEDAVPAVSPDGKRLVFARKYLDVRRWTPGRQLWMMELVDRSARALTEDIEYNHFDFAWSPDGSTLAFVRFNQSLLTQPPEIWVMDLQSGQKTLLIAGGYSPLWIP